MKNTNPTEMSTNFLNRFVEVSPIIEVNTSIESDFAKLNEIRQFAINTQNYDMLNSYHGCLTVAIKYMLEYIRDGKYPIYDPKIYDNETED